MTGPSEPLWVGYLAAVFVVIAIMAVFLIVFIAVGMRALDWYLDARQQHSPARRLRFAAMWLCFALSGVVIAGGFCVFVNG